MIYRNSFNMLVYVPAVNLEEGTIIKSFLERFQIPIIGMPIIKGISSPHVLDFASWRMQNEVTGVLTLRGWIPTLDLQKS